MLAANIEACQFLVQNQYRYFQFYANEFIAVAIAMFCVWKSKYPLHFWHAALAGESGPHSGMRRAKRFGTFTNEFRDC